MSIDLRRVSSPGPVSGARPKGERADGPAGFLTTRIRRLVLVAFAVIATGVLLSAWLDADDSASGGPSPASRGVSRSPSDRGPASDDLASYAFLLPELEGLPPDVEPGTAIEIWVTWEPPVTKKLQVQQLVPRAKVDELIPSIEPGPPTIMLSLERRHIPDLMYGDRYGALSTVVLPRSR
ncbi:MAG: hypothetical protein M3124_03935 [Actinomycetota bacterium]|nr:hypothetical protein [Actinomycetota bacterium]